MADPQQKTRPPEVLPENEQKPVTTVPDVREVVDRHGEERLETKRTSQYKRVDLSLRHLSEKTDEEHLENWGKQLAENYQANLNLVEKLDIAQPKEADDIQEKAAEAFTFVAGWGVLGSYFNEMAQKYRDKHGLFQIAAIEAEVNKDKDALSNLDTALPILQKISLDQLERSALTKMEQMREQKAGFAQEFSQTIWPKIVEELFKNYKKALEKANKVKQQKKPENFMETVKEGWKKGTTWLKEHQDDMIKYAGIGLAVYGGYRLIKWIFSGKKDEKKEEKEKKEGSSWWKWALGLFGVGAATYLTAKFLGTDLIQEAKDQAREYYESAKQKGGEMLETGKQEVAKTVGVGAEAETAIKEFLDDPNLVNGLDASRKELSGVLAKVGMAPHFLNNISKEDIREEVAEVVHKMGADKFREALAGKGVSLNGINIPVVKISGFAGGGILLYILGKKLLQPETLAKLGVSAAKYSVIGLGIYAVLKLLGIPVTGVDEKVLPEKFRQTVMILDTPEILKEVKKLFEQVEIIEPIQSFLAYLKDHLALLHGDLQLIPLIGKLVPTIQDLEHLNPITLVSMMREHGITSEETAKQFKDMALSGGKLGLIYFLLRKCSSKKNILRGVVAFALYCVYKDGEELKKRENLPEDILSMEFGSLLLFEGTEPWLQLGKEFWADVKTEFGELPAMKELEKAYPTPHEKMEDKLGFSMAFLSALRESGWSVILGVGRIAFCKGEKFLMIRLTQTFLSTMKEAFEGLIDLNPALPVEGYMLGTAPFMVMYGVGAYGTARRGGSGMIKALAKALGYGVVKGMTTPMHVTKTHINVVRGALRELQYWRYHVPSTLSQTARLPRMFGVGIDTAREIAYLEDEAKFCMRQALHWEDVVQNYRARGEGIGGELGKFWERIESSYSPEKWEKLKKIYLERAREALHKLQEIDPERFKGSALDGDVLVHYAEKENDLVKVIRQYSREEGLLTESLPGRDTRLGLQEIGKWRSLDHAALEATLRQTGVADSEVAALVQTLKDEKELGKIVTALENAGVKVGPAVKGLLKVQAFAPRVSVAVGTSLRVVAPVAGPVGAGVAAASNAYEAFHSFALALEVENNPQLKSLLNQKGVLHSAVGLSELVIDVGAVFGSRLGTSLLGRGVSTVGGTVAIPLVVILETGRYMVGAALDAKAEINMKSEDWKKMPREQLLHEWMVTGEDTAAGESYASAAPGSTPEMFNDQRRATREKIVEALCDKDRTSTDPNHRAYRLAYIRQHASYHSVTDIEQARELLAMSNLFANIMLNRNQTITWRDKTLQLQDAKYDPDKMKGSDMYMVLKAAEEENRQQLDVITGVPHFIERLDNLDSNFINYSISVLLLAAHEAQQKPMEEVSPEHLKALAASLMQYLQQVRKQKFERDLNITGLSDALKHIRKLYFTEHVSRSEVREVQSNYLPREKDTAALFALAQYFGYTKTADLASLKDFFDEAHATIYGVYWNGEEWVVNSDGGLDEKCGNAGDKTVHRIIKELRADPEDILASRYDKVVDNVTYYTRDDVLKRKEQVLHMANLMEQSIKEYKAA